MTVEYSEELKEEMRRKGRKNISIEVATSERSDFEVTEIYFRYIRDKDLSYMEKKRYRLIPTEMGYVLLPPYRLEYDKTIRFYLKKFWIFHKLEVEGVRL